MKSRFIFVTILTLLSCYDQESLMPEDQNLSDPALTSKFITYLNNNLSGSNLSIETQILHMKRFAVDNNIGFNGKMAFDHLNNYSPKIGSILGDKEKTVIHDLDYLQDIVEEHGYTETTANLAQAYRNSLSSPKYKHISKTEVTILIEASYALELLSNSPAGRDYVAKVTSYYVAENAGKKMSVDAQGRTNAWWDCPFYFIMLAYYTTGCVAGGVPACIAVAYYSYKIATECGGGGGGYIDPCAGSTDPCCGITCILYHNCISGQCLPDGSGGCNCPEGQYCDYSTGGCIIP